MIDYQVRGQFSPDFLDRVRNWAEADPLILAQKCRDTLIGENERGLKAGTNADGSPTAPLQASTVERGRGGYGPPRIPRFSSSRLISGFQVAIARDGVKGYRIRAGWPGLDFVRYINDGTRHMTARPVAGIRPTTNAQLREHAREYALNLLQGGG